jgi:hypothetical protein
MKYKIVKNAITIIMKVMKVLNSTLLFKKLNVLENESVSGIILLKILLNGNNIVKFMINRSIINAIILFSTEACPRNVFPLFNPKPFINCMNLI